MCGIAAGFRADFHFENASPESIHMPSGLSDLLTHHVPGIDTPVRIQGKQGQLSYEIAMARHNTHHLISYANTVQTRSGGDHVRAVKECCKAAGLNAEDYAFFISVFLPHPDFAQPVKDELIAHDIKSFIVRDLTDKLKNSHLK